MRRIIGYVCILAATALLIGGIILYYPKFADYKKSSDLYSDIRQSHISKPADPEEAMDPVTDFKEETETEILKPETENITERITEKRTEVQQDAESETEEPKPVSIKEELKNLLLKTSPDRGLTADDYMPVSVDSGGLLEENEDYTGWIYIPGTSISYPTVYSEDNNTYLHTNFAGEYNYPGTIFFDERCKKGAREKHAILYGHNMRDGSMFAGLKKYSEQEFYEEHPVFWFITPEYTLLYEVFAAEKTDPQDKGVYSVEKKQFRSQKEWKKILDGIQEKSDIDTKAEYDDKSYLMTLSTCTSSGSERYTVSGILIGAYVREK